MSCGSEVAPVPKRAVRAVVEQGTAVMLLSDRSEEK
jgi:hypothetical protein